jgi:hypothetical protein
MSLLAFSESEASVLPRSALLENGRQACLLNHLSDSGTIETDPPASTSNRRPSWA